MSSEFFSNDSCNIYQSHSKMVWLRFKVWCRRRSSHPWSNCNDNSHGTKKIQDLHSFDIRYCLFGSFRGILLWSGHCCDSIEVLCVVRIALEGKFSLPQARGPNFVVVVGAPCVFFFYCMMITLYSLVTFYIFLLFSVPLSRCILVLYCMIVYSFPLSYILCDVSCSIFNC